MIQHVCPCALLQVVASVLQLQSLASQQNKRSKPLAIVASLNSSTTEDVLWHTTLSYHAELQADAARAAELRNDAKLRRHNNKKKAPKLEDVAAAAAAVLPPVSLHLLRPDELMSGMLTQVGWLCNDCCKFNFLVLSSSVNGLGSWASAAPAAA
jgi:hypothetical protein